MPSRILEKLTFIDTPGAPPQQLAVLLMQVVHVTIYSADAYQVLSGDNSKHHTFLQVVEW